MKIMHRNFETYAFVRKTSKPNTKYDRYTKSQVKCPMQYDMYRAFVRYFPTFLCFKVFTHKVCTGLLLVIVPILGVGWF